LTFVSHAWFRHTHLSVEPSFGHVMSIKLHFCASEWWTHSFGNLGGQQV